MFSLQISIFDNKNLFKTQNPCVLLAPASKNPRLKRPEREKKQSKARDTLLENQDHPKTNVNKVSPCN